MLLRNCAVLLVLGFCSLIAVSSAAADPISPPMIFTNLAAGKKQNVVVYGTSLTAASVWPREMKAWFDKEYPGQVTFVNSAGSGMNSDWGLKNIDNAVTRNSPDLVLIEFSYNDAHVKFKMPVERGADNLDKIVKTIQKAKPDCTIVLQIMNVPHKEAATGRPQIEDYNKNYRNYAKAHNLTLLDHYPNWLKIKETDPEKLAKLIPDGSHPSPEGSLTVTWPTIRAWLEESRKAADAAKK